MIKIELDETKPSTQLYEARPRLKIIVAKGHVDRQDEPCLGCGVFKKHVSNVETIAKRERLKLLDSESAIHIKLQTSTENAFWRHAHTITIS